MNIHVFNPEHDIMLATMDTIQRPPKAACRLRHDLGFMPALAAEDGDWVWVNDIRHTVNQCRHINKYLRNVKFVDDKTLRQHFTKANAMKLMANEEVRIKPWGWDAAIKQELMSLGIPNSLLRSDETLSLIKIISNRNWATQNLLPHLLEVNTDVPLIGESLYLCDEQSVLSYLNKHKNIVVKAPWSSSGRGIRYIYGSGDHSVNGWIKNVIQKQGGVMVEPYYKKLMDFGLEFEFINSEEVTFKGISLFKNDKSNYNGNLIVTEQEKYRILEKYISSESILKIAQAIIDVMRPHCLCTQQTHFGIDLMIIHGIDPDTEKIYLHPCIEMNFRQTMGHLAIDVEQHLQQKHHYMQIVYNMNYQLKIRPMMKNIVCNYII